MSKLLRYYEPGQCCFFTSVTYRRQRILDVNPRLLLRAVCRARKSSRFDVLAWVVLPDHIHAIFEAPNADVPRIMQQIKLSFSLQWRWLYGGSGPVWQHRYWDHIIRSQEDMNKHLDYIHYNAVKHGLADGPSEWRLSSFRSYLQKGLYDIDWGQHNTGDNVGDYGE